MELKKLNLELDPSAYTQINKLLQALENKQPTEKVIISINSIIDELNSSSKTENQLRNQIKHAQKNFLKILEKEQKYVPKNHYRNLWMVIGMSAFGIPIGAALGASLDNMGLFSIGLPLGMAVGIAVGTGLDKKALEQGNQLDFE